MLWKSLHTEAQKLTFTAPHRRHLPTPRHNKKLWSLLEKTPIIWAKEGGAWSCTLKGTARAVLTEAKAAQAEVGAQVTSRKGVRWTPEEHRDVRCSILEYLDLHKSALWSAAFAHGQQHLPPERRKVVLPPTKTPGLQKELEDEGIVFEKKGATSPYTCRVAIPMPRLPRTPHPVAQTILSAPQGALKEEQKAHHEMTRPMPVPAEPVPPVQTPPNPFLMALKGLEEWLEGVVGRAVEAKLHAIEESMEVLREDMEALYIDPDWRKHVVPTSSSHNEQMALQAIVKFKENSGHKPVVFLWNLTTPQVRAIQESLPEVDVRGNAKRGSAKLPAADLAIATRFMHHRETERLKAAYGRDHVHLCHGGVSSIVADIKKWFMDRVQS